MDNNNQLNTLNNFINYFTNEICNKAPKNTGALSNSFNGTINKEQGSFNIEITGLNYVSYLDKGVNGTEVNYGSPYSFTSYPNIGALTSYANSIGANPYALSNSLLKKGIKPRGFISDIIDIETENLGDDLTNSIWDDFYEDNKKDNKK